MSKLVAFGCSYTYGVGLPDIAGGKRSKPSNLAWPSIVASKLNIPVINLGKPGIGNAAILDNVLRHKFDEGDICMILWSHFIRYDFLDILKNYVPVSKWDWDKIIDVVDNDMMNAYQNYIAMHHCSLYLDSINIPSVSAIAFLPDCKTYPKPDFLDIKNLIYLPDNYKIDLALDNGHPGVKSQENIATSLLNGLNNVIR